MFSDFQLAQAACVCCNGTKGNPNILFWLVSQKKEDLSEVWPEHQQERGDRDQQQAEERRP